MTATDTLQGKTGLELSAIDWLLDHHKTKEQERTKMVEDLNLKPGDKVLDLGCGPGLWTSMFARKVGPTGRVVGLDYDSKLLEYAKENLKNEPMRDIIEFYHQDFYDLSFKDNTFDLVFFGNCFCYVTDIDRVLNEQKRVTKKGGRIADKSFDGGTIIFHPVDPHLSSKILTATARGIKENPPKPAFDNYFGRKSSGLFRKSGIQNVSTTTYAIQKVPPLTEETKRYIINNAEWYAKIGAPYLEEEELKEWETHFSPHSEKFILDSEDFYFCMLEILTVGTVQ